MQRPKIQRSFWALFLVTTASASAEQATSADCLRVAFGEFCLGGPASGLPPKAQTNDGGKTLAWQTSSDEVTLAKPFDGRIAVVARIYHQRTWLKFNDLAKQLRTVFPEPKDESSFPDYADTEGARATAIELGKGRAALVWSYPGWQYTVRLVWEQKSLMVVYLADELEQRRRTGLKPAF
jgi:hypothetical protein